MTEAIQKKKGRLYVVTPDNQFSQQDYEPNSEGDPDIKILREIVGGNLEGLHVEWDGIERRAYVNEDGDHLGLPVNVAASLLAEPTGFTTYGPIRGTMVILLPDFYEKTIVKSHPTKQ